MSNMQSSQITKACLIPICKNLKFPLVHKFPNDKERFNEWINAIQPTNPIEKIENLTPEAIRKRFFICSRHFSPQQYKNAESRSLNLTAVPILNILNLDDLILSKAGEDDAQQVLIDLVDSTEHTKITPVSRILNSDASNLNTTTVKKVRIVKRSHQITNTLSHNEKNQCDVEPKENAEILFEDDSPPLTKQLKMSIGLCTNIEETRTNDESSILPLNESVCETINSTPPQNKLLALIEVTPEQYEKLSSSLSKSEKNDQVSMILNCFSDPSVDNEMDVELLDGTKYKIDAFWLRDHCQCENCYDTSNHQRKISVLDIPENIQAKSFRIEGDKLNVEWDDDHISSYDTSFLTKNLGESIENQYDITVCHWNKSDMAIPFENDCRVTMRDYMSDQQVSKKVLENLYRYGVALIEGVQPNQQNTEFVIRQLFPIHKTFFGEMWTFSDAKSHSDTAYTNIYLGPHTDNTYFNDAAGLQILHCIQHSGNGGENFLIDGYKVAENIKKNHPEVFERLTKTIVTAEYIEEGRHHKHSSPIINLCPITREVIQVRFNLNDRAPVKVSSTTKIRQFYSDLRVLAKEFEDLENRIIFKLEPGNVLIFDNWRVLHGRLSYSGKRTMTGCYVSRTEYQSSLRVNGFIE